VRGAYSTRRMTPDHRFDPYSCLVREILRFHGFGMNAFRKFRISRHEIPFAFPLQGIVKRLSSVTTNATRGTRSPSNYERRSRRTTTTTTTTTTIVPYRIAYQRSEARRGACSTRTRHEKCAARTTKPRNVSCCVSLAYIRRDCRGRRHRKPQK
jgi:hypothetical protein